MVGVCATVAASFCSSFASVYFEKILKGTNVSLWLRNIQLGFFGSLAALVGVWLERDSIQQTGLLHGFTGITWCVVFMNAFGGLLVAVVEGGCGHRCFLAPQQRVQGNVGNA